MRSMTIKLYEQTQTGVDEFNQPIVEEKAIEVNDVLVAPASTTEIADTLNLTGKKIVYNIALPKGDSHDWEDKKVEFFGETFKTVGFVQQGIEANVPTRWHKKIMVERYE